jgi:hypothetical protein
MGRVNFRELQGKRIIEMDIDNCSVEEFEALLVESGDMIRKEPPGSVLSIAVGGEGTPIFTDREMFIDYLVKNMPHMKASVVCGLPKMKAALFQAVVAPTGRQLKMFDRKEDAVEWLVNQ